MNITTNIEKAARGHDIDPIDAALMDIARMIQITQTMHDQAEDHYYGLARHIDRAGSPFEGRVAEIYPSGSFAIHAATRSRIKRDIHDVDAVVEIEGILGRDPQWVLDRLYEAIKGEPGSRYYDYLIEPNSRCITITYPDGVTVDLMPVARLEGTLPRVARLFHSKPEAGESYCKEINPKGFADTFNARVETSTTFQDRFDARRFLVEGRTYEQAVQEASRAAMRSSTTVRADTQSMPVFVPLDQKAPRVVALQLEKRFRDKRFRKHDDHRGRRKPPSVVLAAEALDAGPTHDSLLDEVVAVANHQLRRIRAAERRCEYLVVTNPAHKPDVFTDRWPAARSDQRLWSVDLEHLIDRLTALRRVGFTPALVLNVFDDLFGETTGMAALDAYHRAQSVQIENGTLGMTREGKLVGTAPKVIPAAPMLGAGVGGATTGLIRPARANTNMGGVIEDDHNR